MTEFIPGLELARGFYIEAVAPLLRDVSHSAALLGWGSDVLGFDTPRSTDHGWGPRLTVFIEGGDASAIEAGLEARLPAEYRGWPTRFGWDAVSVSHHVEVAAPGEWLENQLGFDPRVQLSRRDWLTAPQQALLEVTAGTVFHDGLDVLQSVREALRWYPDDVWLWLLACQWRRIDQEEPFVGRAAEVGDELGSRVIAARLVRDIMRLCFLLERRYAPYSKWLGSAFRELAAARSIEPPLLTALAASGDAEREAALLEAVVGVARQHNALAITPPVETGTRLFHGRPFRVLGSSRLVDACLEQVTDPWLRSLPLIGAIDQFIDSTDVLSYPLRTRTVATIYESD